MLMDANVYLPYPSPQTVDELNQDVLALLKQPGVPDSLLNEYNAVVDNPETQDDIDQEQANSDSMANE
jgi:hypothetical protein